MKIYGFLRIQIIFVFFENNALKIKKKSLKFSIRIVLISVVEMRKRKGETVYNTRCSKHLNIRKRNEDDDVKNNGIRKILRRINIE